MPSEFIQGQPYFAINDNGGNLGSVPVISSDQNYSKTVLTLSVNGTSLKGIIDDKRQHFSATFVKYFIQNYTSVDSKSKISQYYNQLNPVIKFTNFNTIVTDSSSKVTSDVNISNVISRLESKNFLLLKSLIFPHQFPKKISNGLRFIPYKTIDNNFVYQINFTNKIKLISKTKDIKIENKASFLNFCINVKDEKTITIDYQFKINKVELNESEIREYENLNEEMLKKINSSIEYEIISD